MFSCGSETTLSCWIPSLLLWIPSLLATSPYCPLHSSTLQHISNTRVRLALHAKGAEFESRSEHGCLVVVQFHAMFP